MQILKLTFNQIKMKKNISTIIAIIVVNMMVQAQESPEIWMSYDLMPKKGMVKQFEAAVAKKNKKFNTTPETAIFTFKYMDGENQGKYQRVMGYKDWDFFNNQQQGYSAQQKYWAENVDQFVENQTGWKVWSRSLNHSHNWTATTTFKHMYVWRRFIKPGHEADVYNFLDRGAKVIASAFIDFGFDVKVGPLFQTPTEAAEDAMKGGFDIIGISTQAAGHKTLAPQLIQELEKRKGQNILVICGGVIPQKDHKFLEDSGVSAIFGPGTNIPKAADEIIQLLFNKKGRNH